jgi:hypothetical protein
MTIGVIVRRTGRERDTPGGVFSLPRRIHRTGRYWSGRRRNHQGVRQDAMACQCQCVTESPRKLDNAGKLRDAVQGPERAQSNAPCTWRPSTRPLFFFYGRHGGGELIGEGEERACSRLEMVSEQIHHPPLTCTLQGKKVRGGVPRGRPEVTRDPLINYSHTAVRKQLQFLGQ